MTAQQTLFKKISTFKHLPTLPHVLLKLIEACNQENPDMNKIGQIVSKDPALSGKIMQLVNSAAFGLSQKVETINQAVVILGTSGVKNIVFCACVYDAFPKPKLSSVFSLKKFWWHSLRCAFLSRHMAEAWGLCNPDEAFLAGLLHDIGRAVLWVNFKSPYEVMLEACGDDTQQLLAQEDLMGATHAEVGAFLLKRWRLAPFIIDCVRYHHQPPDQIAQALAMVQVVYVANLLCQDTAVDTEAGAAIVNHFFNREDHECQTLIAGAEQEARETAVSLDIEVDAMDVDDVTMNDQMAQDRLAGEVRQFSLTIGTLEGFLTAKDQSSIMRCVADGLKILFDVKRVLFFLMDEKKNALIGYLAEKSGRYVKQPMLAISLKMTGSLLVNAFVKRCPMNTFNPEPGKTPAIVDQQLIQLLGGEGIYGFPLVAQEDAVGILALGLDGDGMRHLTENHKLLHLLAHKGALALRLDQLRKQTLPRIHASRMDATTDLARRVVHEINNPLGVIKNYLKVMDMKMADAGIDHEEIRIIGEEISRVGRLLNKLTAFSKTDAPVTARVDVERLLADMLKLIGETLGDSDIRFATDIEPNLPVIEADSDGLKQVFLNLIKNAAEAMPASGGRIAIRARHLALPLGGKSSRFGDVVGGHVEIVVSDNGPGIPEAIREKPFDPYVTTKNGDHAGLGLSVAHRIIQSLNGTITCESVPGQGTTFTIDLPVHPGG
ncbi:hypothetical protein DSCO28_43000 [Desulfosarcina ovata subsp. sediminis]|uniref:histidine kinase n=1 Tax=Desulfosarcina ovata subsp. sediminis TaxID=885957 RepID=A0A5K7ZU84_9BACT|nr:HDOD domain-containing protein [Desulfosarcina ovata]BBO83734.1 hypothetical protein DSCO28_43000 [Desulfosarcina ovata subsp. sediminis]